jgi:TRAP-type C4-dicarboxylate transport system permease small subunit
MKSLYTRAMDKLYWVCIGVAVLSICATTTLVFVGTMARDLFGFGAMYSEQLSIMFAIQMTFYGAAACYRAHAHLSLGFFVRKLSPRRQLLVQYIVFAFFFAIACSMIYWGVDLAKTTMFQHYAEFPWEGLKVGYIYSAVPISGCVLLLFVLEQIFIPESRQFHGDETHGSETEVDIIRRAQEGQT